MKESLLPEETFTCPTCGKVYKAIFLAGPVNYNCYGCYSKTCTTKKQK